jgi:general secretion pathway protein F
VETYEFVAANQSGEQIRGVQVAESELALDRDLEQEGLLLTSASAVKANRSRSRARLSSDELVTFTTQLATVTGAGIPLIDGLEGIGSRLQSPGGQELIERLVHGLQAGQSLSEVMEPFPQVFPLIYTASVRAGESSGALDTILTRMANHLEWARAMRATAIQALIYPALLMCAIMGLIALLLLFVLPKIMGLFPEGGELPWQTQVVLTASDFLRDHVIVLGCLLAAAIVGVISSWRIPRVKVAVHGFILKIPKLGALAQKLAMSRFASTTATLHSAGCDVFTMLQIGSETCGNAALSACFDRAIEKIRQGESISDALSQEPAIDPLLVQMIHVGERAGALDTALLKLASYYDDEVPRAVKKSLAILEPMILLGAGGAVAFILMAAVLPLFALYDNIG